MEYLSIIMLAFDCMDRERHVTILISAVRETEGSPDSTAEIVSGGHSFKQFTDR